VGRAERRRGRLPARPAGREYVEDFLTHKVVVERTDVGGGKTAGGSTLWLMRY